MPAVFSRPIFSSAVFAVADPPASAPFLGPYLLTTAGDTTDATSYTTATITPTAGYVQWLVVATVIASGTITTPTVSGGGLGTWTLHTRVVAGASVNNLFLYRAYSKSTVTPAAVTINFSGQTQLNCVWMAYEVGNVEAGGTNGATSVVQTVAQDDGVTVGTSMTITLGAFADVRNPTLGVIAVMFNSNTAITRGSGFNQLGQTLSDDATPSADLRIQVESTSLNDTTVDWTFVNTTNARVMGIAMEFDAVAIGGGKGGGGGGRPTGGGGGGGSTGGGGKPPKGGGGGGGGPTPGIFSAGRKRWRLGVI